MKKKKEDNKTFKFKVERFYYHAKFYLGQHKVKFVAIAALLYLAVALGATLIAINSFEKLNIKEAKTLDPNFSVAEQLDGWQRSHQYYYNKATKDERLIRWVTLFSKWNYVTHGDIKYGQADCVGALWYYFNSWGSNFALENIPSFIKRAEQLATAGQLDKRTTLASIKSGDIIVIQVKKDSPEHFGVVYDIKNEYIQYFDMNAKVKGMGIQDIQYGDWRIYAIYQVSFQLWLGDWFKQNK